MAKLHNYRGLTHNAETFGPTQIKDCTISILSENMGGKKFLLENK